MDAKILDSIKEIISEVSGLEKEELTDDIVINESDITSITLLEVVANVESELDIELLPDDMNIQMYETLGDMFRAFERAVENGN